MEFTHGIHKAIGMHPLLHDYLISKSYRPHPQLNKLFEATFSDKRSNYMGDMCSPFDSVSFLQMLMKLIGAKKVLEIGTYTGFTALAMALALPDDGKITTLDINVDFVNVGKPFWEEAGVSSKIDVHIGIAREYMQSLAEKEKGTFDLVFIDADKINYDAYYELSLQLIRPGGVIVVDNVLWSGNVIIPSDTTDSTASIRALNDKIHQDERVDICMLPLSDGVSVVRKK